MSSAAANSIAWLVWHLTRVQDSHISEAAGVGELWRDDGWRERFGLDLPATDTGYGHDADDAAKVRATAELLADYHAAVAARTTQFVRGLQPADLDRAVDESWTPPVTLGMRLVSVLSDCLQHVGQARLRPRSPERLSGPLVATAVALAAGDICASTLRGTFRGDRRAGRRRHRRSALSREAGQPRQRRRKGSCRWFPPFFRRRSA